MWYQRPYRRHRHYYRTYRSYRRGTNVLVVFAACLIIIAALYLIPLGMSIPLPTISTVTPAPTMLIH